METLWQRSGCVLVVSGSSVCDVLFCTQSRLFQVISFTNGQKMWRKQLNLVGQHNTGNDQGSAQWEKPHDTVKMQIT